MSQLTRGLPALIKIGAILYRLEMVDRLVDSHGKLDGRVRHSGAVIQIEDDMNQQARVQTTLHEIVHVVATQLGHQDLDDGLVDAVAYAAYQVLRDNPDLVRAIMRKERRP